MSSAILEVQPSTDTSEKDKAPETDASPVQPEAIVAALHEFVVQYRPLFDESASSSSFESSAASREAAYEEVDDFIAQIGVSHEDLLQVDSVGHAHQALIRSQYRLQRSTPLSDDE